MSGLDIAAALVVPVGIWVLWRIQALSVELLRRGMGRMFRFAETTYNIVSTFGVLLHELSHAVVLLLTGHGVREFHVRPDEGHVMPRRRFRNGLGDVAFVAAAFAPMFVVPLVVLVALHLLLGHPWPGGGAPAAGWDATIDAARDGLLATAQDLTVAVASLNLTQWQHASVLGLMLLAAPGLRPSHVKEEGQDVGDIAVIRSIIRRRPLPFLLLAALVLAAFFVPWGAAYWLPARLVAAVGVVGILTALLGAVVWTTVAFATRTRPVVAWIPMAAGIGVQWLGRAADWPMATINGVGLAVWVVLTVASWRALPRRARLWS